MDIQILLLLQQFREAIGGCLNSFFAFITTVAVDYYLLIPALVLFWAVDKKKGARVLSAYGTGCVLNALMKAAFCVYRPWIRDSRVKPLDSVMSGATGYSFPSGHSTSTASFYGGMISQYRNYKPLCVFCVLMVLLTMFSRLYVGVHTPQDVLAGAALGVIAALFVCLASSVTEKYRNGDVFVLIAAVVLCAGALLLTLLRNYPMDYVDGKLIVDPATMSINGFRDPGRFFGIVVGWFIERRFVKFEIRGTALQKVARCVFGGLFCVFYFTVVISSIGKLIRIGMVYFLLEASLPILLMTVYPLIFTKLQK